MTRKSLQQSAISTQAMRDSLCPAGDGAQLLLRREGDVTSYVSTKVCEVGRKDNNGWCKNEAMGAEC